MTLADFRSYVDAQNQVSLAWHDAANWTRMSILTPLRPAFFDRPYHGRIQPRYLETAARVIRRGGSVRPLQSSGLPSQYG